MRNAIGALLMAAAAGWAQQHKSSRPDFNAYAVERVYTGAPASPKLSKSQRMFRTRIREGARSRVEFAGHYTVPRWGCGAGCSYFVIVDSITGTVYDGFNIAELPLEYMENMANWRGWSSTPKAA